MIMETFIKKKIKKLKETFPDLNDKQLERELLPLPEEGVKPKVLKKKVKQ
jgi:hypothetical protein